MRKAPVAILAALLAAASAQGPKPAEMKLAPPVKLAYAGVKIAIPADFELKPVESQAMLLRAVKVRGEAPLLQMALSAFHAAPETKVAEFAKNRSPSKDLWVRDLRILKSMSVKVAGVDGEVQVQSYRLRDVETTALCLYFVRPVTGGKQQVGYVLVVEATKKHGKLTLPVLMAVMKTIELSDPVSPLAEPLDLKDEPIVSEKLGYSLRPPTWWFVATSPDLKQVSISRLDYTSSAVVPPRLHFEVVDAKGRSAAQCADDAISVVGADLMKKNLTYKVVSRQATKLAGIDGEEFIIRAVAAAPAGSPDLPSWTVLLTQRVICHAGKSYNLTCQVQTDDVKVGRRLLDAFSPGVKLAAPASRPAPTSAPTTAPAIRIVPPAPAPPTTAPATVKPAMVKPAPAPKTVTPATRKDLDELERLIP